jgi:nicotinamidase-related amidase
MPDRHEAALFDRVRHELPISLVPYDPGRRRTGLVIVDEVNGFATVGAGNLAPRAPDAEVDRMIEETVRLAGRFETEGWPIFASLDTHLPDRPEPPYPPHCIVGTGEENLIPALEWLEGSPAATLLRKDCINIFVGAMEDGRNRLLDWVAGHRLEALLVVGICTDICVMDLVLTLLSARNHGLMPGVVDIAVYERACATYDLPRAAAEAAGLPPTAAHPQALAHHLGLYFMASRGAVLADRVL